jgi:hypothetical protein
MALFVFGRQDIMDDPTPTDAEPVVRCEPAEHADVGDDHEIDLPPVADERTLEEAGYGYGV